MNKTTSGPCVRMSAKDARYGGNLVDGAHMLHLFGGAAAEMLIRCDGDKACSAPTAVWSSWLPSMQGLHQGQGRNRLRGERLLENGVPRL